MTKKQTHLEKKTSTCIVVGPMPFKWSVLKKSLKSSDVELFFIDGGLIHRPKFLKNSPELLRLAKNVGDGDSSKVLMQVKKTDQNLSDLAFFLRVMANKKHVSQYIFVGFLGGRHDHHLFNLGEIFQFVEKMNQRNYCRVLMEECIEFFPAGKSQLKILGTFSLASFQNSQVKISGECLYKSHKWLKLPALSSRGLSNEGYGDVIIESTTPILVFFADKKLN